MIPQFLCESSTAIGRMIRNHEDEFIAVRVQDPRLQNEGSWNSYVDYKIFLHTNSKAFTAKTSCVRRRYSEFVWLKKKMQKNSGLVPVPDLPGKSFFSFNNEDFLERRRTGLQTFLDTVLHMTVFLSDSLLHLFLQTQLPVGHILDCVQGHTPYTVTDAILTYASSNRGLAQAQTQEDDLMKEPSLVAVSYESMESPLPHLPTLPNAEASIPGLPSPRDHDPLEALVEGHSVDLQLSKTEASSIKVLQGNNYLQAVVEQHSPVEATFYLGDTPDDLVYGTQPRNCQNQTPVEVHSPMGSGFEDESEVPVERSGRPTDPGEDESDADSIHEIDGSLDQLQKTLAENGEVDLVRNGSEEGCDEDSQSLRSSDGSIPKISDEESIIDKKEVATQNANVYSSTEEVIHRTEAESSSRDILRLETNCYSVEKGGIVDADNTRMETNGVQDAEDEEEELLYISDIGTLAKALDLESSRPDSVEHFSDNGDFDIPQKNYEAESVGGLCSEQVTLSSLCVDSSE